MTAHPAGHADNSRTRTILGYGAFVGFAAGGGVLGWLVRNVLCQTLRQFYLLMDNQNLNVLTKYVLYSYLFLQNL